MNGSINLSMSVDLQQFDWVEARAACSVNRMFVYPWHELRAPANLPSTILAVIGVLSFGIAIWSLLYVKKQVGAFVQKERARLYIAFPPDSPQWLDQSVTDEDGIVSEMVEVSVGVILDGGTSAYNVTSTGWLTVTTEPKGRDLPLNRIPLQIPKVIPKATVENPVRVVLAPGGFGSFFGIPHDQMEQVRRGVACLYALGSISYEDVFGKRHVTPFRFRWKESGFTVDGQWQDTSEWMDESAKDT